MSITDDVRPGGVGGDDQPGPGPGPRDGEQRANGRPAAGGESFDRTPPQDVAAEQCVLGGMLLSKDAIADVIEILKPNDFYRPVHTTVFDAVLDLYGRGEPADPITVAAALADAGALARVGGAAYLHTLIASVPTAANAAYYARIVAERAVLRRLVEAGTRIVQLGYGVGGGSRDVDDVVDLAQQAIYDVTEKRVSEDFAILADVLQPTLDEIEAVGSRAGMMTGIPTGFTDLDRLLNGLHAGQLIIVAGRPGLGKALALDTALPTPEGWTTMGAVTVGDELIGPDGRPTLVTAVSEIMRDRPCHEIVFSDNSVITADAEHRWLTSTRSERRRGGPGAVRTTREILATLRAETADRRTNHSVTVTQPLDLPEQHLPVPPYTLGVWLGDGHSACHAQSGSVTGLLRGLGVLDDKHIPQRYLRGSLPQRRALLAGLLDTDGTVAPSGTVQFTVTSGRLADDVFELIVSLGYRCSMTRRTVAGRRPESTTAFTLTFSTADEVFRLERKRLTHKRRCRSSGNRNRLRYIVDVRQVASVPVRCVTVDNADHLYLAGRSMIPTHNSTAAMDFVRAAAVGNNLAAAIFSLEMSKVEIVMRLLSAEARVPLHVLRSGQLSDDDWTKLARRMGEISEAPLFVDDTPNMTLMEIRAKARRLRQRHDLKLIIVDYLQLMTSPKRTESRQQEVADLSRGLKLLAKEVECPVVAVSQLNRGPEQRTDKRPQLSDLRESGCMTEDTTLLRADTGAPVSFGELLRSGQSDVLVWSLDEQRRMVAAPVTSVFPSGVKPTFQLVTASGRTVKASGNHPFLTVAGWRQLGDLTVGDRIAVPRRIPEPVNSGLGWSEHRIGLLARLIGDCGKQKIPDEIHRGTNSEIAVFLRHLWATGGNVTLPEGSSAAKVSYSSPSRHLADGVMLLLARFGIVARLKVVTRPGGRPGYHVVVADGRSLEIFCRQIGVHGARGATVSEERVRAGVLDADQLQAPASDDVFWDPVTAIEPLGDQPVYDATVKGTHNFVADGIVAHNSIEQDADVVILLHRDDYYDKESPRAGEADFIVAKHRNGPTDTITVAAQLHLSRFVDIAIG